MEYSGACPCVENRNPSIESTSLILLLHNSHHMFLLFCQQRNRSRLAVFADVLFPKTHTQKQRQSECRSNSNMNSFPFTANTAWIQTAKDVKLKCHFFHVFPNKPQWTCWNCYGMQCKGVYGCCKWQNICFWVNYTFNSVTKPGSRIVQDKHQHCKYLNIWWKELTSCGGLLSFPAALSSVSGRLWAGGGDGRCVSPVGGAGISLSASCCSLRQLFLGLRAVSNETCVNGIYYTLTHTHPQCSDVLKWSETF